MFCLRRDESQQEIGTQKEILLSDFLARRPPDHQMATTADTKETRDQVREQKWFQIIFLFAFCFVCETKFLTIWKVFGLKNFKHCLKRIRLST